MCVLSIAQEQLTVILDSKANAKMLSEILHVAHKPVQIDANDKQTNASKYRRCGFNRK